MHLVHFWKHCYNLFFLHFLVDVNALETLDPLTVLLQYVSNVPIVR